MSLPNPEYPWNENEYYGTQVSSKSCRSLSSLRDKSNKELEQKRRRQEAILSQSALFMPEMIAEKNFNHNTLYQFV